MFPNRSSFWIQKYLSAQWSQISMWNIKPWHVTNISDNKRLVTSRAEKPTAYSSLQQHCQQKLLWKGIFCWTKNENTCYIISFFEGIHSLDVATHQVASPTFKTWFSCTLSATDNLDWFPACLFFFPPKLRCYLVAKTNMLRYCWELHVIVQIYF